MADLLVNECSECYEITLPECLETIEIDAGLTGATDYDWCVVDKFGNKYKGTETTDAGGTLTLTVSDFPTGLFTAHSGAFTLTIMAEGECEPFTMTMCTEEYTCILIEFENVYNSTQTVGNIPCCT